MNLHHPTKWVTAVEPFNSTEHLPEAVVTYHNDASRPKEFVSFSLPAIYHELEHLYAEMNIDSENEGEELRSIVMAGVLIRF